VRKKSLQEGSPLVRAKTRAETGRGLLRWGGQVRRGKTFPAPAEKDTLEKERISAIYKEKVAGRRGKAITWDRKGGRIPPTEKDLGIPLLSKKEKRSISSLMEGKQLRKKKKEKESAGRSLHP